MSKRKNRNSKPNIPESTLERARRQLAEESGLKPQEVDERSEPAETPVAQAAAPVAPRPTPVAASAPVTRTRSSRRSGVQPIQSRSGREPEKMDQAYVRSRLENPTRLVTEDQLRQEYVYVVRDLRWLFGLAFTLIAAMIVVGQLLSRA